MFSADDTIVAVATPPGRGGLGVVRLSGPDATRIARVLVARPHPFEPRRATFARIVEPVSDATIAAVDQVVVTFFEKPRSYTGDDTVEISGHGSPVLLQRIVELCLDAGARLAEPGEFTLRAHLNGRLDLVQAEAVADLVDAVTPLQARAAMDQLEGTLTGALRAADELLLDLTARLEASLDFPDEGFHFMTRDEADASLRRVATTLDDLATAGRRGRVVREGRLVVIAGPPNAGKSSLFNALAGAARAIVTDVPGTTRDVLTERVDIGGVPVTLVDTAGLREALDAIEAEGVARARQAQALAALTMIVLDGSRPIGDAERRVLDDLAPPRLVVISKADLGGSPDAAAHAARIAAADDVLHVSARTGQGLDALRAALAARLGATDDRRDTPAISNVRHLGLVDRARAHVARARHDVQAGATEELVLVELVAARQALEEVTGRRAPDDLLQHIFSRFCVGK
jgi:tRNA modification GTPase